MVKSLLSILALSVFVLSSQLAVRAQEAPIQNTPLIQALLDGNADRALTLLAQGANASGHDQQEDNGHKSALAIALSWNKKLKPQKYTQLIMALLDHGADVNAKDDEGTPLFHVDGEGPIDTKIVRLLLDHGADPTARNNDQTPLLLHFAQVEDKAVALALVGMLLQKGVGVDTTDDLGWTALDEAACQGTAPLVTLLLDHGADINHVNSLRRTPLLSVCGWYGGDANIVRLLIEHGASLTTKDKRGQSALILAIGWCAYADKIVPVLLDHGAEIDGRDSYGRTALMWAADRLQPTTIRLLLDHGAAINATDSNGLTPLMHAVTRYFIGDPDMSLIGEAATKPEERILPIVKLLIDNKAAINLRNRRGGTALSLASEYARVKDLLKSQGAIEFPQPPPVPLPGPTP